MTNPGKLKLNLFKVGGAALGEDVEVELRHLTRGTELRVRLKAGAPKTCAGRHGEPDGVYRVAIAPPSYMPVSRFISVKGTGTTALDITFPVDSRKVKRLECPDYADLPE